MRACFRWAAGPGGLLEANPVEGLSMPPPLSRGREALVTPEQHGRLMEAATPALADALTFLRETGCRPCELCALTAAHVDLRAGVEAGPSRALAGMVGSAVSPSSVATTKREGLAMFAVVESVECASCGGRHDLCVALDNYSPAAAYEYFCPRTNEAARATPHKDCAPVKACPWRSVYAKRVDQ